MKQLNFIIGGQELTRTDTLEIVSDAIGQFEAVFTFDEWWNGFTPTAQFTKDGKTIDCLLSNNKCIVPPEALQGGGVFYVNVFSTDGTGDRKTANEVAVPIKTSGYKKDGSHSQDPSPTVYEQLLAKVEEVKDYVDESSVKNGDGVVASPNADFAEVAEWNDGNPNNEDRIGYFVCFDVPTSGIIMRKANADDDVKGITVSNPSFAGNCTKDKFDENGKLLPQYEYVGVIGLVPVHDNGQCVVGERCVPADGGLAAPSPNDKGYQVVGRYSDDMVLIAVEPNGDMVYRLQEQIDKNRTHWKEEVERDYVILEDLTKVSGEDNVTQYNKKLGLETGKTYTCDIYSGDLLLKTEDCIAQLNTELNAVILVDIDGKFIVIDGVELANDGFVESENSLLVIFPYQYASKVVIHGISTTETIVHKIPSEYYDSQETLYRFNIENLSNIKVPKMPHLKLMELDVESDLTMNGKPAIGYCYTIITAVHNLTTGEITKLIDIPAKYDSPSELLSNSFNNYYDYTNWGMVNEILGSDAYDCRELGKLLKEAEYIAEYKTNVIPYSTNLNNYDAIGLLCVWAISFENTEIMNEVKSIIDPIMMSNTHIGITYKKPAPIIDCGYIGG